MIYHLHVHDDGGISFDPPMPPEVIAKMVRQLAGCLRVTMTDDQRAEVLRQAATEAGLRVLTAEQARIATIDSSWALGAGCGCDDCKTRREMLAALRGEGV